MKHSYSHYRYDPDYDSTYTIPSSNTLGKHNVNRERAFDGRPRKKSSSFTLLRERRVSSDAALLPHDGRFRTFSSNLLQKQHKLSKSLDDNIQRWNMKSATFCELSEPEMSTPKETAVTPPDESDSVSSIPSLPFRGSCPNLSQYNKQFGNVQTHSYHDQAKVNLLKKLVHMRLKKGDDVAQLAKEPLFEDVLDICDENHFFPAYEVDSEVTFEDYRALRKCKYLRLSEKNIASLKEATLNYLNDEKD